MFHIVQIHQNYPPHTFLCFFSSFFIFLFWIFLLAAELQCWNICMKQRCGWQTTRPWRDEWDSLTGEESFDQLLWFNSLSLSLRLCLIGSDAMLSFILLNAKLIAFLFPQMKRRQITHSPRVTTALTSVIWLERIFGAKFVSVTVH